VGIRYCNVSEIRPNCQVLIGGTGRLSRSLYKHLQIQRPDLSVKGFVDDSGIGQVEGLHVLPIEEIRDTETCILLQGNDWMYEAANYVLTGREEICVLPHFSNHGSKRDCIVVDEARFIYVPVYKAAYSSMRELIRERFSVFAGTLPGSVINTHIDLTDSIYLNYYKFSFVRNPFARVVSCYEDKLNVAPTSKNNRLWRLPFQRLIGKDFFTFKDFVLWVKDMPDSHSNSHWRSQWATLYDSKESILVDHIGYLENIHEDFQEISKVIGINLSLPHLNVSRKSRKRLSDYYIEETAPAVMARYWKDFKVFGYDGV
jgi:Sulfotransferase family